MVYGLIPGESFIAIKPKQTPASDDTYILHPAMMAQWLGCRTRNHKVASSSPVTAVSSLGIGSLNHN